MTWFGTFWNYCCVAYFNYIHREQLIEIKQLEIAKSRIKSAFPDIIIALKLVPLIKNPAWGGNAKAQA